VLCAAAHNTYVRTWAGWLYLATVIDCFNKEVIGYAMADHMRTSLVTDALEMAARNHDLAEGCIFHSDRGTQYTSSEFAAKIKELDLRHSLGRSNYSGPRAPVGGQGAAPAAGIQAVSVKSCRRTSIALWSCLRAVDR